MVSTRIVGSGCSRLPQIRSDASQTVQRLPMKWVHDRPSEIETISQSRTKAIEIIVACVSGFTAPVARGGYYLSNPYGQQLKGGEDHEP
jgi:hypothetical protein